MYIQRPPGPWNVSTCEVGDEPTVTCCVWYVTVGSHRLENTCHTVTITCDCDMASRVVPCSGVAVMVPTYHVLRVTILRPIHLCCYVLFVFQLLWYCLFFNCFGTVLTHHALRVKILRLN